MWGVQIFRISTVPMIMYLQVWLVIFPEGTRYNPELPAVIEKSRKFAKDQGE